MSFGERSGRAQTGVPRSTQGSLKSALNSLAHRPVRPWLRRVLA